ncbi:universal stress protein [Thermodesulfovibrio sp. TK110]
MYSNILVAFDGSEFSKAALFEAVRWVKKHGGHIIMVHAVYFDEEEFIISPEHREQRIMLGKQVCYQMSQEVSEKYNIQAELIICEGDAPDVILQVADDKKADLIVMGTYGKKGLKKLILGSTTYKVIVESSIDVMAVKKISTSDELHYRSILVAFDESEYSKKALQRACELAKIEDSTISVIYVIPRYQEMVEFFSTESIKHALIDEAKKILSEAEKIALKYNVSIKKILHEGSISEKIVQTANLMLYDLIIMGTYGWKGVDKVIMGSNVERVIINSSLPVIIVK